MHPGTLRPSRPTLGPAHRSCIQCGRIFPSREPSHRVCQACQPGLAVLRPLTSFDPWLAHPDRGRRVESCPAGG